MTKIIIDTNIAFSAMLNTNSHIGQILINGSRYFRFYAPEYIQYEILAHKEKIKALARLDEESFRSVFSLISKDVTVIGNVLIPKQFIHEAIILYGSIDMDDVAFIALTNFIDGLLWTGDKRLIAGLKSKGFTKAITTNELFEMFLGKENQKA